MEESLFASEPRSLRMDRKSPEAVRLREAVSKKLLDFLGNYSDEVLAEYIVVLVCNGKHQTQARDDLQAFLGDESGKFVAWLWNYLSEEFITEVTHGISDSEAKRTTKNNNSLDREYRNNTLMSHHSHSVGPQMKNGSFELSSCHADNLKLNQVSERLYPCQPNLDVCSAEVNLEGLNVFDASFCKSSGSKSDNLTGEQSLHCEPQNRKIQKNNSSTVPSQHIPEPKTEQTAIGLQSVIAEEHQLRPLSSTISADTRMLSTAADDLSHQIASLRGNVWDRLGRPCVLDQGSIKEEKSHHLDFIDGGKLDNHGEELQSPRLTRILPMSSSTSSLNRQAYAVDRGEKEGISVKSSSDCSSDKVDNMNNMKRKIEVGEFCSNSGTREDFFQDKKLFQQQRQSLPIKQKIQQNMNKFAKVADKSFSSDTKLGLINTTDMVSDSKATFVPKPQVKKDSVPMPAKFLIPVSTTLPANSSQSKTDGGHANQKPINDDMLAVKSKLQQIEMDMLKLRSKQVVWSSNGKQYLPSVVQIPSEESLESRTVLVANVHFAATKESLISHFGKCGIIAKVIMLTDAVTGLLKGAAYIVFANKESVDKAISLNGTSFFSRILKVIRKVEVPPDYLVPSQPTPKHHQPFYPPPYGKGPIQKPHASSHLQWRRDQRPSGDNSLTTSSNGPGSSSSVE